MRQLQSSIYKDASHLSIIPDVACENLVGMMYENGVCAPVLGTCLSARPWWIPSIFSLRNSAQECGSGTKFVGHVRNSAAVHCVRHRKAMDTCLATKCWPSVEVIATASWSNDGVVM